MRNDEYLYSPEQLVERLGISLGTLYRWNYTKTGPLVLHLGRHCRYRPSDVDAWLETRAAEALAKR